MRMEKETKDYCDIYDKPFNKACQYSEMSNSVSLQHNTKTLTLFLFNKDLSGLSVKLGGL